MRIVFGLITCRNSAGLEKLLNEIEKFSTDHIQAVIVVDNDQGRAGIEVCERLRGRGYRHLLIEFEEYRSGIPYARNRVLCEARRFDYDYVGMIDDDEYPSDEWLEAMLTKAANGSADLISGPVRPVFEAIPEPPLNEFLYYKRGAKIGRNGSVTVESTANVLMSKKLVEAYDKNWFSVKFAETGGSDTEFFHRAKRAGFRHEIAENAIVYEDIPKSRLTLAWNQKRAFRSANNVARIRIMHHGYGAALALETMNVLGLTAKIGFHFMNIFTRHREIEFTRSTQRLNGKIAAFFGKSYKEYSKENYRR
jgi:succinoglycan biosynthesis protein ExoM